MSIVGLLLNLLLVGLLVAALVMGWRLNRRLKALRDSHDGFAVAVRELNAAATRAEQGLADLRAATDEATDVLADRIEKGRALAAKLERLTEHAGRGAPAAPAALDAPVEDAAQERRLGALLAAARDARARPERRAPAPSRPRPSFEDELFEAPERGAPMSVRGGRP